MARRRILYAFWLVAAAALVSVLTTVVQVPRAAGEPQDGWTDTPYGPLGPGDRDFLVKVRQAGLWEGPTGQQAQQRAGSQKVKDVGMHLAMDHGALDEKVREVAGQLDVVLPSQPNADQLRWMGELSTKSGADYDRTFAMLLRAAHGKVFAVVAGVRAGTRNELIREFATEANTVVMRHMTLLESTGLVNFTGLPAPPDPAQAAAPSGSSAGPHSSKVPVVIVLSIVGLVIVACVLQVLHQPQLATSSSRK